MQTPSPQFATIDNWCNLSGMGRRTVYDELGLGNLKAVKVGARTLIDVEAGLAWLRSQPAPVIRPPQKREAVTPRPLGEALRRGPGRPRNVAA
jgi:hypothetical protein